MSNEDSHKVEILPEFYEALMVISDFFECPIEGIVQRCILERLIEEHTTFLDFKRRSELTGHSEDFNIYDRHLTAFDAVRKKLYRYEDGSDCISCDKEICISHDQKR